MRKKIVLLIVEILLFMGVATSGYFIHSSDRQFGIKLICLICMYGIYYKWFRKSAEIKK